ncbi:MAG TPA: energy transducer TonB [Candidatus Binatia bacterium]|nr:energy transducer TonB [Candidatus Binatia bacterium]
MTSDVSSGWGDLDLFSLCRSPFLLPSLLLHAMLFLLILHAATFSIVQQENVPISVQLLETGGGSDTKSIGPSKGPGGPRTPPKLGNPIPPAERTGKLETGSVESLVPSKNVEPEPAPKPVILPGPKALATNTRHEAVNAAETSPDSLVRLPTKESPTHLPSTAAGDLAISEKNLAALKGASDTPGIKALKEGAQVPGALKGTGTGIGPYGVPGGSKSGTGLAGVGTGTGTGGGSQTGLKGLSNADYSRYLNLLKKRVESVWKYPDDVTGVQKVTVRFALDRAGKLTQAVVLESSDSRLNASAVEAMKRASPFPPIPESLKDLANEPLIMRFEVSNRVRG